MPEALSEKFLVRTLGCIEKSQRELRRRVATIQ